MRHHLLPLLAFLPLTLSAASTGAGITISHHPSPSPSQISNKQNTYLADPAITVAPDGSLLASHSYFGGEYSQLRNRADTKLTPTKLFRSTDGGSTWTELPEWPRTQHASYFTHNNTLYSICTVRFDLPNATRTNAHIAIRKSTDNGLTWTPDIPTSPDSPGYIRSGSLSTPKTPALYNNRIWIATGVANILSAPLDSDLLDKNSWTYKSAGITANNKTIPDNWPQNIAAQFDLWAEPQIVASPQHGVAVLPKIEMKPVPAGTSTVPHYSYPPCIALLKTTTPDTLSLDPATAFVNLPGTDKKFGAIYDPATKHYFALTNTVLPAFEKHEDAKHNGYYKHQLTRNTGTLYSSPDLIHWDLRKIFIHSNNVEHDAWQYFNFVPQGDDLLIASRTAFKTKKDRYDTPRGHDSNQLTFHRIPDYKNIAPLHLIKIEKNTVTRSEITDYDLAPLGNFPLGPQPKNPVALAYDPVFKILYIQQKNNQVLTYDKQGNFRGTSTNLPANRASSTTLEIPQGYTSQCTWIYPKSGDWLDPRNWHYFTRPDTANEHAYFGSATTAPATITLIHSLTLNGLTLDNPNSITLATGNSTALNGTLYDTGTLTLSQNPDTCEAATLNNYQGHHIIQPPLSFADPAFIQLNADTTLNIDTLTAAHPITLVIYLHENSTPQPSTPPLLTIQTLTTTSTLNIRLSGSSTPKNTALLKLTKTNLHPSNITLTSPDGTPIPFTYENGTLSTR